MQDGVVIASPVLESASNSLDQINSPTREFQLPPVLRLYCVALFILSVISAVASDIYYYTNRFQLACPILTSGKIAGSSILSESGGCTDAMLGMGSGLGICCPCAVNVVKTLSATANVAPRGRNRFVR
jgi:hypothetical protein